MNLESRKVIVSKSTQEIFEALEQLPTYEGFNA